MLLRALFNRLARPGPYQLLRRLLHQAAGARPLFMLPELIDKPAGERVLVLAPHPDDETLGCGGTLRKHALAGDRITVAFLTDGSGGDAIAGVAGQALVELRENEARAAASALGIAECVFLRNPDGALRRTRETIAQVARVLTAVRPQVVYVPSPLDAHRDHQEACAIAAAALHDYAAPAVVFLYEVWGPVPANCAVQIDLDAKLAAIRHYRSQMDERELYVLLATHLARYRGITCLPGNAIDAECFLRLDRAAFMALAAAR